MVFRDVLRSLRLFRHEPGFALAVVLTLALGIGTNVALFAVVDAVLLQPLPYAQADRMVVLTHRDRATGETKPFIALGDFVDLRQRQQSLEALAGYGFVRPVLTDGETIRTTGLTATPAFFAAMRIQPLLGRTLAADDVADEPGAAMISADLWRSRFGSTPDVLTRSITLDGHAVPVVGVLPAGFEFPVGQSIDVVVPLPTPATAPAERKSGWIFALGRLRPATTHEAAAAEFRGLSEALEGEFPAQNQGSLYEPTVLRDAFVGDAGYPLWLLLGAGGLVLLLTCANTGNLMLARALTRSPEMALRVALGATLPRLAMQVLVEGAVLATVSALVAIAFALLAAPVLVTMVPLDVALPAASVGRASWRLALFSGTVSAVAACLFSTASLLHVVRAKGTTRAASGRRTTASRSASTMASTLVVAELTMATTLLIGGGLTLRSVAGLLAVDPGFRVENTLTLQVQLPSGRYDQVEARRAFFSQALEQVNNLAGVEAAGTAVVTPLTGNNWTTPLDRADEVRPETQRPPEVGWQAASPGYFQTLRIPLRAGRLFDERDDPSRPVVIISEAAARQVFRDANPVGRRIRDGSGEAEIVGVVGDVHRTSLADPPWADLYVPFARDASPATTLFVRTAGSPESYLGQVRTVFQRLDPTVLVDQPRTLAAIAEQSAAVTRLTMRLLGTFAVMSVVLAAVGVYGVVAYRVRQRAREFGTRMALGAQPADVLRLVLRGGALLTLTGIGMGVALAGVMSRVLSRVLYGVGPFDPLTTAVAAIILAVTAMAACYLPARAASRIPPARALTSD